MNVLLFVAHPDDEMVFAGGLIALMTARAASVHLVAATCGEGGETDAEAGKKGLGRLRRMLPPTHDTELYEM